MGGIADRQLLAAVVGEAFPADFAAVLAQQDVCAEVVGGVDGGAWRDVLRGNDASPCVGDGLDGPER